MHVVRQREHSCSWLLLRSHAASVPGMNRSRHRNADVQMRAAAEVRRLKNFIIQLLLTYVGTKVRMAVARNPPQLTPVHMPLRTLNAVEHLCANTHAHPTPSTCAAWHEAGRCQLQAAAHAV